MQPQQQTQPPPGQTQALYPAQPGAPSNNDQAPLMAQTYEMKQPSQSATTTGAVTRGGDIPPNYIAFAALVCCCCNPCFGGLAVIFAMMSSSEAKAGRIENARQHGVLSMQASMMGIFMLVLVGVIIFGVLMGSFLLTALRWDEVRFGQVTYYNDDDNTEEKAKAVLKNVDDTAKNILNKVKTDFGG